MHHRRTQFDEEALDELADSIRTLGVIQPITVKRQGDGKYIIISGERRWRSHRPTPPAPKRNATGS